MRISRPTLFAAYLCIGADSLLSPDSGRGVDHNSLDNNVNGQRRRSRKRAKTVTNDQPLPNDPFLYSFLPVPSRHDRLPHSTPSPPDTHSPSPSPSLNDLPAELLLLIFGWVATLPSPDGPPSPRALAPITRTSRRLRALARPLLYAHIAVPFHVPPTKPRSRDGAPRTSSAATRSIKLLHVLARDARAAECVLSLDSCPWNSSTSPDPDDGARAADSDPPDATSESESEPQAGPPQPTAATLRLLARAVRQMPRLRALTCDRQLPFWVWRDLPATGSLTALEVDFADTWPRDFAAWLARRPSVREFRFTLMTMTRTGYLERGALAPLLRVRDTGPVLPNLRALTAALDGELASLVRDRPITHATFICLGGEEEVIEAANSVARAFAANAASGIASLTTLDLVGERTPVIAALKAFTLAKESLSRVVLSWGELNPSCETGRRTVRDTEVAEQIVEVLSGFTALEEVVFWVDAAPYDTHGRVRAGSDSSVSSLPVAPGPGEGDIDIGTPADAVPVTVPADPQLERATIYGQQRPGWSLVSAALKRQAALLTSCPVLRRVEVRGLCSLVRVSGSGSGSGSDAFKLRDLEG